MHSCRLLELSAAWLQLWFSMSVEDGEVQWPQLRLLAQAEPPAPRPGPHRCPSPAYVPDLTSLFHYWTGSSSSTQAERANEDRTGRTRQHRAAAAVRGRAYLHRGTHF